MSDTARAARWRTLLASAFRVVDSLEATGYGALAIRLGGGTVLMFRFDHRVSDDIDLFIDDARALGVLTPRLHRLDALRSLGAVALIEDLDLTASGQAHLAGMIDRVVAAIRSLA